jgi:peptidoglycan/LPS O-acetylase OafA/YrhL
MLTSKSEKLGYRADIDGLRAISVIAVVLFHAGLKPTGGYVGVDVFFVLSGFLITNHIYSDLQKNTFSLRAFWKKRICRIWPAVTAMTIVVLATGFIFFLPKAYEQLANDSVAQICLVANYHFLETIDYFTIQPEFRPLLHTWSLAVEEQFYIVFPLALLAIWKYSRQWLTVWLVCIASISFAYSVWQVNIEPESTFYLLPTRAWELLMGSILAVANLPLIRDKFIIFGLSLLGLGLVVIPMFIYDATTVFPGLTALYPCLGAAILIHAGSAKAGIVSRSLSIFPLRTIGLMSYSIYLWHWPLLTFMRYTMQPELSLLHSVIAIFATLVISYLSWQFIENKCRVSWSYFSLKKILWCCGLICITLILVCGGIKQKDGLPGRFSPEVIRYSNSVGANSKKWRSTQSVVGPSSKIVIPMGANIKTEERPDFLLWGDSHAMAISELCDSIASKNGLIGFAALRVRTLPIAGIARSNNFKNTLSWNSTVFEWIKKYQPKNVLLCARWSVNIDGRPSGKTDTLIFSANSNDDIYLAARQEVLHGLQAFLGVCEQFNIHVYLMLEVPRQRKTPEQRVKDASGFKPPGSTGITLDQHLQDQNSVIRLFDLIESSNLTTVDLASGCFNETNHSLVSKKWTSYYRDDDHLSAAGVEVLLGNTVESLFSSFKENNVQ